MLFLGWVKGQDNPCTDYVASRAKSPCNATLNTCFFSFKDSPVELLDACLCGIFIEDKGDMGFPNGNMSGDIGSPVVGQAVPTTFPGHPLLGSFTGREEPMFHLRPLVPMQPVNLKTSFHLYTTSYQGGKQSIVVHYSSPETIAQLVARQFPMETLYVIAHDFNEDIGTRDRWIYDKFKDLLFDYKGATKGSRARPTDVTGVLLVDWQEGAKARNEQGKFYRQAAVNTMIVGREIGLLLHLMVESSSILVREEDVHLIGNGLGAHVMHFAAQWYKVLANNNITDSPFGEYEPLRKLGRLTALDPFAPHFQGFINLAGNVPHVDIQDATFVDVIHTASNTITGSVTDPKKGFIGMSHSVGDVDIYVNGGRDQPACSSKALAQLINPKYVNSICSHKYALLYFMNSLLDKPHSCSVPAIEVDDWSTYVKVNIESGENVGKRFAFKSTFLGISTPNYSARGIFWLYLVVNSEDFSDHLVPLEERLKIMSALKPKKILPDFVRITKIPLEPSTGEYPAIFPKHQDSISEITMNSEDLPDCGLFRAPSGGRIRGGHPAYVGQFPWNVSWDIALVRLDDPIPIPAVYDGGPLNSLCWRSANQFPYNLGDKLIFAGFGNKGPTAKSAELTWMDISVTQDTHAMALNGPQGSRPFAGYTHYQSVEIPPKKPCGGDSGGPYMWYVKRSDNTSRSSVSPYRAILVGTEIASNSCDFPLINEKTGLLYVPDVGSMVGQADIRAWLVSTVETETYNIDIRSDDVPALVLRPA
ncbi:Pancreatic lipase-related protein 2 [Halotydeus destructor]|nr:Pancreatic lipase-related protein 2 [Halotydeus destructor]